MFPESHPQHCAMLPMNDFTMWSMGRRETLANDSPLNGCQMHGVGRPSCAPETHPNNYIWEGLHVNDEHWNATSHTWHHETSYNTSTWALCCLVRYCGCCVMACINSTTVRPFSVPSGNGGCTRDSESEGGKVCLVERWRRGRTTIHQTPPQRCMPMELGARVTLRHQGPGSVYDSWKISLLLM